MSRVAKNSKEGSRSNVPVKRTGKQLTKEAALMETLHDAEIRQQQDFIKTRSRQLDEEIKTLRSQLKISGDSIENDSLKARNASSDLKVSGFGLGRVEFNNDKFADSATTMKTTNTLQFKLDDSKSNIQPKTVKDHLVIFLAKIKLKMEDVDMSSAELRELLLPSDLVVPDEYTIPIAELTGVLQTDLVMPVTKSDQMMLLNTYGHGDGEVDVRRLLMDAGVWHDGPTNRGLVSPDRRRHPQEDFLGTGDHRYPYSPERSPDRTFGEDRLGTGLHDLSSSGSMSRAVLDRLEPLPTDYTRSQQQRDVRYTGPADKTAEMLDLSERNLDDLHELHEMILGEKEYDFGTVQEQKRRPFQGLEDAAQGGKEEFSAPKIAPRVPPTESSVGKENNPRLNASDSHEHLFPAAPTVVKPAEPSPNKAEQEIEDNRLSALARENERLKKEIGSFDAEFFEQLEDLKFRYSRLQEIVGEDPAAHSIKKGSALPLDRLSWSVRNSMTAMDRAGLTSPLVSRPRYSSAHTYAPGGAARGGVATLHESGNMGNFDRSHVGGTLSAAQQRRAAASSENESFGLTRPLYESRTVDDFGPQRPNQYEQDYAERHRPRAAYPGTLSHSVGNVGSSAMFGGTHGIGAGTHSFVPDEAGGSFSNLCERRLAFELSQHRAPEQATRSLIHRVMDAASRPGCIGFITCPQLAEVFHGVGLKLSPVEIELLATGFASDGKGGVDAVEFCEAVKSLLYNLLGEHAARAAEVQARYNGSVEGKSAEDDIHPLMIEICEGIITHDKRAVIGNSPNIFKTLLRPFVEQDTPGSGVLAFRAFHDVLKDIGVLLTHQDVLRVARHYNTPGERPESAYPTSNLNHIQSFRDNQLRGSLRGAAKTRPVIGDWLATSGVGLESQEDYYGNRDGVVGGDVSNIDYTAFVTDLAEMLIKVLERDGGVVIGNSFPWILKEFEFVDALICQLEEMKPSQRRKVLMSLQYALSAADPKGECDLDGFTVLNALLSSGFRLQRVNRVRLLRAVEELGGKMDYRDLCQVLLNSCADWTVEEKQVVQKILKSMGVTVIERRNWLAKLRQTLMDASSKVARKTGRWFAAESGDGAGAGGGEPEGNAMGIPPSAFLHCLRDCGVVLNVEEEATLLDCLDTERLAKVGQIEAEKGSTAHGKETWSIPMIEYDTFLHYCTRHCGSWTDASPEIGEAVKWAMKSISNPVLAVHEFASLMHAFDETSAGHVSKRAFQICCHRSRLLANLPEESITSLADILSVDGGGKINYTNFIVYLRATCSHLEKDTTAPGIIDQLIANATDNKGTLLPLRNWLMRNTDMEAFILTPRDMNSLLREFSVMYRPEDLESLQMDIGKHVDSNSLPLHSQRSLKGAMDADLSMRTGNAGQSAKKHVIDSRDLMLQILKARPRWTSAHPYLCTRMLKAMQLSGKSMATGESLHHLEQAYDTSGAGSAAGNSLSHFGTRNAKKSAGGPRGVETAIARRILSRLRAFAGRSTVSLGAMDRETRERDGDTLMVERDIFKHLTGVTGLPLTDEDVLILADATDFLPEASRVRCDVIVEVLFGATHAGVDEDGFPVEDLSHRGDKPALTEACLFALDHLRHLLWKNAARLHRSTLEWVADVHTVFKGFDKTKTGFISSEDFAIALNLLNATISQDLLMDISYIPEGPGLIDYREILDHVLIPPSRAPPTEVSTHHAKQHTTSTTQDTHKDTLQMKVKKKVVQKESPVQLLLNVVRKSLHHFIVSDHSLEQAWVCLLKVFQRFDPQETNQVSPRDFCLAVSVLLDGDDVVLTKSEWAEIIDHFASLAGGSATQRKQQADFLGGAQVDYMLFCETVLDPSEIKARLAESRAGGQDPQSTLDRGKQFLSKSTPLQRKAAGNSATATSRGGTARSGPSAHTYSANSFQGNVVGSGFTETARSVRDVLSKPPRSLQKGKDGTTSEPEVPSWKVRPQSASSSLRGLQIDAKDDEILKRFQEAPRRAAPSISSTSTQRSSGGGAMGYNNAGAAAATYANAFDRTNPNNANITKSSATAKKSEWNTDELYRVARTQGQASRASARGRNVNLRSSPPRGSTSVMQSTNSTYAASHATRGSGTNRFHWEKDED